jgi:hypothetical protein
MVCSCADHVETSGVHCYMCTICMYLWVHILTSCM